MALDIEWVEKEYWDNQRSICDIAKELGTYNNAVRRALLKGTRGLRSKAEAQTLALSSGRHTHPTKGKHRPDSVKRAISATISETWANLPEEEKQKRSEAGKQQWNQKTAAEKSEFHKKAIKAVRKTSVEGSKLEKFLHEKLTEEDITTEYHKKGLVINDKLEIDIFLPELTTIIEVDGPSHFTPIWGNDALLKTQKADNEKNGLILEHGFCVIRIKQLKKNLSLNDMWKIWDALLVYLKKIQKKYPPKNKRFMEIEVKNT